MSLIWPRRLPRRGEPGHDPSTQRRIGRGKTLERFLQRADQKRIDTAHHQHAAVGQAGAGQQLGVGQLARDAGATSA
jgi:hypothetical protein